MKIGSLCTGYGGLDLAVEEYFNAKTIWCAEFDKYASKVIEQRFGIPNYGDIKQIDWASLESIDILTAGYPCQPFSHAGYRKGTNDERHIFPYILEAISVLRPQWVILENVRGHLSLGLKEVLAGLTSIGYDAKWQVVRASEVGAPHQRARIFIIAYSNGKQWRVSLQDKTTSDANSYACQESRRALRSVSGKAGEVINGSDWGIYGCGSAQDTRNTDDSCLWTIDEIQQKCDSKSSRISKIVSNTNNQPKPHNRQMQELGRRFTSRRDMHLQPIPDVLDKNRKLNAMFVEYMMGLPVGWVTDTGLSRAQQLKMLGNGVVPQQAYYALELLLPNLRQIK